MRSAYDHTFFRGKPMDVAMAAALEEAEGELGYELTVLQGIGNAAASSDTHSKGRMVDLAPWDYKRKLRVLKDLGFYGWYRAAVRGLWPAHIHVGLILNSRDNERGIAPAGFRQLGAYDAKRDGLVSNRPDPSYRATPKRVFVYPPKVKPKPVFTNHVTKARDALVEAAAALGRAATEMEQTSKNRVVVQAAALTTRAARRGVNTILRGMPKR